MNTLIFGPRGFIGSRLVRDLPNAISTAIDINNREAVRSILRDPEIGAVVNAAGKVGRPNVDECELRREDTYRVNVVGALTLAEECARAKVHLIHLGSGCIFYGRSSHPDGRWRETDWPNPQAFYSKTKAAADAVLGSLPGVAVVRLRMPIDSEPDPRNLITKLASYPLVMGDVPNSVTVIDDLIEVIQKLIEQKASGVFHVTNPGVVSHREILKLYREMVDPSHQCEFISETQLRLRGLVRAPRSNCVLASTRLAEIGVHMPPIAEVLPKIMRRYSLSFSSESETSHLHEAQTV